jgi:eukaryotic-like serine/threonine-protein kinase
MPVNCPDCGYANPEGAGFCESCGAKLSGGGGATDTVVGKGDGEKSPGTVLVGSSPAGHPESFGRYRVLRELGRGAMGVVYLARDDRISRNVAIKALHLGANLAEGDRKEITGRFNREAQAAGMLSHPNIVTIYDVGEQDGTPYIAMEYLEGATLTEIASEGPLSIPQATDITVQILSALSYAHGHDIVHRDIKPDNIFLLPDGRVKVADFGIARITSSSTMTQVGQVMGTPGYMSPEQVKGETVGPSSDIFSTAVVFYELLTGTAAFSSASATSIMYKIVHEEPRPAHLVNPGVPANLEAVITVATAKNPASRYREASGMKHDIESGASPVAPQAASHDGTVLRGQPLSEAVPVTAAAPTPADQPEASGKKKAALWAGIAGGGFVVVAAVIVVILIVTGVFSSKPSTSNEVTVTEPEPPQTVSLKEYLQDITASSEGYDPSQGIHYVAWQIWDDDLTTCWSEGVRGYGEGESITFNFREPVVVREVDVMPGYAKRSSGKDRFQQNGKLQEVMLEFSDGSPAQFISFENREAFQRIPLQTPVETTWVKVTINKVYPGVAGPSWGAASDTSVSEFHLEGCAASAQHQYENSLKEYEGEE